MSQPKFEKRVRRENARDVLHAQPFDALSNAEHAFNFGHAQLENVLLS